MRKQNSNIPMEFISEKGADTIHKTYVAYTPLDRLMCVAVAESYDNDTEINSARLAVETVLTAFEKAPSMRKLKQYIKEANEQILLNSTRHKLKVSITVIVSDYTRMRYAVCGNTKLFVLYEAMFSHVSDVQTEQEPHNLTQYLGIGKIVHPYISKKIELVEDSSIVLATSNFWAMVADIELLDAYENSKTSKELLENVEELLLSRQDIEAVGSYTVSVFTVEKTFKEDTMKIKKRKRRIKLLLIILIILMIIGGIVLLVIRYNDRKQIEQVEKYESRGDRYVTYGNYSKSLEEYGKAVELAAKLNVNNWQYTNKKEELIDIVEEKSTMLTSLLDAADSVAGNDYEQAILLYGQVIEISKGLKQESVGAYAQKKLDLLYMEQEIANLIALGDMYETSLDHEKAVDCYTQADELLKKTKNIETRKEVQLKLYDIKQLQNKEEETAKGEKEETEAQEQTDQINTYIVKLQVLLTSAKGYLSNGKIPLAETTYQKILEEYKNIGAITPETDKVYADIVALEQSIAEAKDKSQEEEKNNKLVKAQEYAVLAKASARKEEKEKALSQYQKALDIYKELNVWDDSVTAIYEEMYALEYGSGNNGSEESEAANAEASIKQEDIEDEAAKEETTKEDTKEKSEDNSEDNSAVTGQDGANTAVDKEGIS